MTLGWQQGRKLSSATVNGTTFYYDYDGEGNRYRKTNDSTVYSYTTIDGVIYAETQTVGDVTTTLHYLFDETGTRYGFVLNGTDTYYYKFNLQGDVIGIYNESGSLVVIYKYDAWGKLLSTTGPGALTVGAANPFRYRGYYYDAETGFYLTGTRYYDPEIGRFINADGYVSTGQGVLANNMFAYCLNNPTNGFDPCGTCFHHLRFWTACDDCKKKKSSKYEKIPLEKFANSDGSFSFYDNHRFRNKSNFHEQILVIAPNKVVVSPDDEFSIQSGGSFDLITGGWETEQLDLSLLDFGHAEANVKFNKEGVKTGALVSIWSPSFEFKIGKFTFSYGVEVGAVGAGYERTTNSIKTSIAGGIGSTLEVAWE